MRYLTNGMGYLTLVRLIADNFIHGFIAGKEILIFLRDWLINHIQKEDKKYIAFLNERGVV